MRRTFRTATFAISGLTALAWVAAVVLSLNDYAATAMGFIPARLSGAVASLPAVPAVLTPLTATLVHANLLHIATNLLVFVWCGHEVERALGRTSLVVIYVVGAFAAAGAQWLADPLGTVPMIGASGAISAIMAAFALSFGRPKLITRSPRTNRWLHIAHLLVAWVILQLMLGWLMGGQGYLLATPAHIGGFAAGLLLQRPLLLWRYRNA
ncbi:MAG TPA: rhomboid family intramembrane serine protease [Sphingomicrobium sp.]